ncbi:hypothetical protein [Planococcus sp. CAU13]|uniref:hypothetical protein n=1 Tax=Planococcus sp. CAU13 TaxID=1541197 RepID=UPI00052FF738|nr:hypothetical protein [Planococcus sp. CAU13]
MRHELHVRDLIITTDNSGAIGEKERDEIKASDLTTAKFSARVALLEQWAAGSEPFAVLLHNFSGAEHWERYVAGITELFRETGLPPFPITGSSETNMKMLQSALSVTMIGERKKEISNSNLKWYVYGLPLTGENVIKQSTDVADLKQINELRKAEIIESIWPVGSKGIAAEVSLMLGKALLPVSGLDLSASGGPSTAVLIGAEQQNCQLVEDHLNGPLFHLSFID